MSVPAPPPAHAEQTLDFAQPFRFVFADPDWLRKVLIGGLFTLLSALLIGIPFVAGYMVQLARNVIRGEQKPLPEWENNFETFFIDGMKLIVITLVYFLPLVLIWLVGMVGVMFTSGSAEEWLQAAFAVVGGCGIGIAVLIGFLYSIFLPAAMLMYAATDSMAAAFDLRMIFSFVFRNLINYALAYVVHLVAQFLSQFGLILLCVGIVFAIFWSYLVSTYAFADAYRLSRSR